VVGRCERPLSKKPSRLCPKVRAVTDAVRYRIVCYVAIEKMNEGEEKFAANGGVSRHSSGGADNGSRLCRRRWHSGLGFCQFLSTTAVLSVDTPGNRTLFRRRRRAPVKQTHDQS
jgi:hypothetical protein